MALHGCATPEATAAYAARLRGDVVETHFRVSPGGLTISSIGLGTYLGQPDDATDTRYQEAILRALTLGCNHIDTAVNYRCQRSERVIGRAVAHVIEQGTITREEIVIATKGGFVPFDNEQLDDPRQWVYRQYIETGLVHPNEFAANYQHCLTPDFLDAMIQRSRHNLGVETIDIYYLHNPETQRISNTHETFRRRMLDAFETLEDAAARGDIGAYGVATWTAFRSPPTAPDYVSLTELMGIAYEVAGEANRFRYVQMPYNLIMTEAFAFVNQQVGESFMSPVEAANELGLTVVTSASLKQGLLASPFMADLTSYFPGADTDAQRALQFVRSTPGVTTVLTGMSQLPHVEQNLALAKIPPVHPGVIRSMFPES